MPKAIAARRGENGELTAFLLDTGEVFEYLQAIQAVESGYMEHCNIGRNREGEPVIRSDRDNDKSNNLSELPEF